jgi:putative transposase
MKRSRFTEAQIVSILRSTTPARQSPSSLANAVQANTLRLWKSKYSGLDVSGLMRLKELEDENTRMRRVIAKLTLENDAMKELASKTLGPSQRKEAVKALRDFGVSERAACRLASCPRGTAQYRSRKPPDDPALLEAIKTIAGERPRSGRRRLDIFIHRKGFRLNERRFVRI